MTKPEFDFKNTLMETLGIEIVRASRSQVVATLPVSCAVLQPFGYLHGGALTALAETAASVGALQNIDTDSHAAMAIEINANFIASVREGAVTASATPLHIGKTSMVWEIKITDEAGKLLCASRCTIEVVPRR